MKREQTASGIIITSGRYSAIRRHNEQAHGFDLFKDGRCILTGILSESAVQYLIEHEQMHDTRITAVLSKPRTHSSRWAIADTAVSNWWFTWGNEVAKVLFAAIAVAWMMFALYLWGPVIRSGVNSYLAW